MYLPEPVRRLRYRYQRAVGERRDRRPRPTPPLPPGTSGGPPDFVGLGAQKAGTTWWFNLIIAHPGAEPSSRGDKELSVFDRYWNRPFTTADRDAYYRMFPRTPGILRGEWTPEYLLDPWAVARLSDVAPATKLLVLLRDPIDRFRSSLTHITGGLRRPTVEDVRIAYQRGCYLIALQNVLEHFPRSSLLVLQYERCQIDPRGELRRTFAHLGLDDHPVSPSRIAQPRNMTEIPKVEIAAGVLDSLRQAYRPQVADLARAFPEIETDLWPNVRP